MVVVIGELSPKITSGYLTRLSRIENSMYNIIVAVDYLRAWFLFYGTGAIDFPDNALPVASSSFHVLVLFPV